MLWGKFRLGDLDPRHLSVRPFLCLLLGFALFFVAGWFLVMGLGGWWAWLAFAAGLALLAVGVWAATREKRELADAGEEAGA